MPAGIEVRNDAGVLQIDETYINFTLVSQGTATTSTFYYTGGGSPGASVYYADVTVTGRTSPMLAIRSSAAVYIERISISGGSWTWRVLAASGVSFDWFCFDLTPAGSLDTFGLEVFNASGVRVFHSSQKPMRIAGEYGYDGDGFTIDSVPAVNLDPTKSYAVVLLKQGYGEWVQDDVSDQRAVWYSGSEAGAGFIRYARVLKSYDSGTTGGGVSEPQEARLLAIDVTNY